MGGQAKEPPVATRLLECATGEALLGWLLSSGSGRDVDEELLRGMDDTGEKSTPL